MKVRMANKMYILEVELTSWPSSLSWGLFFMNYKRKKKMRDIIASDRNVIAISLFT